MAHSRVLLHAMNALDLTLADKDAMGEPAGKVDDIINGAVVLAVGLRELNAYPLSRCKLCCSRITDDTPARGDGDDGAQRRVHGWRARKESRSHESRLL